MPTVSKEIAIKVAENNGVYPGDPQCFAVFHYKNSFFNNDCYAIAYNLDQFKNYSEQHFINEILWIKELNG